MSPNNDEWDPFAQDPGRYRIQISGPNSYDGPPDALSALVHTYEKHRVGVPALHLSPLQTINMDESSELYRKYMDPRVQKDIQDVLKKYEIEVEDRDLVLRRAGEVATVTTLYIQTPKGFIFNAANQRNCVAELYHLLQTHEISTPKDPITIELIGYELYAQKHMSFVPSDHPIYTAWETSLRDRFIELSSKIKGHVWSIDLIRLGFDLENEENNPVVISLTVEYWLDPPDWDDVKGEMERAVREAGFEDVLVDFGRGEVWG